MFKSYKKDFLTLSEQLDGNNAILEAINRSTASITFDTNGFSVVATEVRNLSNDISSSTIEISEIISNFRNNK